MNRFFSRTIVAAGLGAAALGAVTAAQAHTDVFFSIGVPVAPAYVEPAPVYVQPRPVYVEPRPVYGAPPAYIVERGWEPSRGWESERERHSRRREWERHEHRSHHWNDRRWD